MSELSATQIPRPADEQAFERACKVLFRCILNDPTAELYGKKGTNQYGVDIYGIRDGDNDCVVGIQCKLKEQGKDLDDQKDIIDEVKKARKFEPLLSEYFVVSTAPDRPRYASLALKLSKSESEGREKPIKIRVLGWESLEREIRKHEEAHKAFDPGHTSVTDLMIEKVDKLATDVAGGFETLQLERDSFLRAQTASDSSELDVVWQTLDNQITDSAELLRTDPDSALVLLNKLKERLDGNEPARLRFRVAANIAACGLEKGNEEEAANALIAAYDIDPQNPKAISNKALGLLLLGREAELIAFALERIADEPEFASLASFIVQARIKEPIEDPLEGIPSSLWDTPEVSVALTRYKMECGGGQDWWESAERTYDRFPDADGAAEYYSSSILERLLQDVGFTYGFQLSEDQSKQAQIVQDILQKRWDKIRDPHQHTRGEPLAVPLNLVTTLRLLGDDARALEVARECFDVFPDQAEVRERLAGLLVEQGQENEAIKHLDGLPIDPDIFMMRFVTAMHSANWPEVRRLKKEHFDLCPPREQLMVKAGDLIGRCADLDADQKRKALEDEAPELEGDPRAMVALSKFSRKEGLGDFAESFYEKAISAIGRGDASLADRSMVAQETAYRGDHSRTIEILHGFISKKRDTEDLRLLGEAIANEYPVRSRAEDFFSSLPDSILQTPMYRSFNALTLINQGLPDEAIELLEAAFNETADLGTLILLHAGYFRAGRQSEFAAFEEDENNDTLSGSALQKVNWAHIILNSGYWDRAINLGYDALCSEPSNPNVVMKFCGLVLDPSSNRADKFDGKIASQTWFQLNSDHEDVFEAIVDEDENRSWGDTISSKNDFAKELLGKREGDVIAADAGFGVEKQWTIVSVKPNWLQAFHKLSRVFSQMFPGTPGFVSFTTKDDDISEPLRQVKKHSESRRAMADLYLEKKIPASIAANHNTGSAIAFAEYLVGLGEQLQTCVGNFEERKNAFESIKANEQSGVIIDALTAWRAAELGVFGVLSDVLGPISIPNFELDVIKGIVQAGKMETRHEGETMMVSYENGEYYRQVITPEDREETVRLHKERLRIIEEHCAVEIVVIPDELSEMEQTLISTDFAPCVSPVFIRDDQRLLLSDDFFFRGLVESVSGRKGVWLQAVLMVAEKQRKIDFDDYCDAAVLLAAHRHSYVSLSASVLRSVHYRDEQPEMYRLRALCHYVGNSEAEPLSHIDLVSQFITLIWTERRHDLTKIQSATSVVLRSVLTKDRGKNWRYWAAEIFRRTPPEARRYFVGWLQGHFLPIDEVNVAINHIQAELNKKISQRLR